MANERRYGEDEVKEIFERAAEYRRPGGRALATGEGEGLGLKELQAIGAEVGLSPDRIAEGIRRLARVLRQVLAEPAPDTTQREAV